MSTEFSRRWKPLVNTSELRPVAMALPIAVFLTICSWFMRDDDGVGFFIFCFVILAVIGLWTVWETWHLLIGKIVLAL